MASAERVGDRCVAEKTRVSPIEQSAQRRIAESRDYGRHFKDITIRYSSGVLTLYGRLPTFYLKQVLQSLLRNLEGVERIDNQVTVGHGAFSGSAADGGRDALSGLDRIRNAGELLTDHATPLSKRLLDAGAEFLSAIQFDDDWPNELRRSANRIRLRLLANGNISSSVRAMDDGTLDETAEELLLFVKAAEHLTACSRSWFGP